MRDDVESIERAGTRSAELTLQLLAFETKSTDLSVEDCEAHVGVVPGAYVMLAVTDTGAGMEEALRQSELFKGPIHLLLTNVVMPRMNGREVAGQVALRRPDTRVLDVSGYTEVAIVQRGVLEPGIAFLPKPITPDALLRRVREVLDAP